jgi:predicted phage-related endonuclease
VKTNLLIFVHFLGLFDYEISFESDLNGESFLQKALLEVKNVNEWKYKKDWKIGFEVEATPYIELQVQHQLLVSGLETAYIGALIGGCKGILLKRQANKKVQDAILRKAEMFWKSIDESENK